MPLTIFLYIYWAILAIFFVFNLLLLRHILKLTYLGSSLKFAALVYFIAIVTVAAVSHIFIFRANWDLPLF